MDKNYYKEYYTLERNHWWFKIRAKIILFLIDKSLQNKPNTKLKILNVGAATCKSSEILSQYGDVTSLEFDKDCCDFVKNNLKIDIISGSLLNLPFANQAFDVVCAFDVIEHVEDDLTAVTEMKRVCKNGGLIVVTVPAFMSLWSEHDVVNHHFRRYTKANLLQLFYKIKLKPTTVTYFNTLLFLPIFIFRMLGKLVPQKWIRKGAGSDATIMSEEGILNSLLYRIFGAELFLLKFMKFPFGVSIFLALTKNDKTL
jgi:SAM-dependent methyltransferase